MKNMAVITKKKTIGNFGEQLACEFLIKRGYQIVGRNERSGHKELDIIARLGKMIVFVEVKTLAGRNSAPAEEALSRGQIETIKKAINAYSRRHRIKDGSVRFDFIAININRFTKTARIKHYADIC